MDIQVHLYRKKTCTRNLDSYLLSCLAVVACGLEIQVMPLDLSQDIRVYMYVPLWSFSGVFHYTHCLNLSQ